MNDPTTGLALEARGLAKRYGAVQAVSCIDLTLAPGAALGLLGPNGAGKSTTLSMLMGLQRPDAGRARIFGLEAGSAGARRLTGATPQATDFPDQLSPREIISYTAARYGTMPDMAELAARFGLEALMDRRTTGFSGGQLRRVSLALAFVGAPRLVFLDEPTAGLDAQAQAGFQQAARDYVRSGGALVLTSHHWDEIEAICDAIALIDHGETVLSGRIDAIRTRATAMRLGFALPEGTRPPDWTQARAEGARWHIETEDSDALLRRLVAEGIPFEGLTLQPLALKDLIARIREDQQQQQQETTP